MNITKRLLFLISICISFTIHAQEKVTIKGEVYDEYLEPFSGALIKTSEGKSTTTNINGEFKIKTTLPVKIKVSYIGYSKEEITITDVDQEINLILKENSGLEQIVLSASRIPERLFESPVSIERISLKSIKNTSSTNFYNSLINLKNIDIKHNSIGLQSVNTKGFSTIQNFRFVQLIDGVNNEIPALNFSPGNLIGVVDMDVENVELLTGASSALYGANAYNGIMLIKTKNPFDYTGISVNLQTGITDQETSTDPFFHPNIRLAHKFDNQLAAKASFSLYSGEEWHAKDYRSSINGKLVEGEINRNDRESYNGINEYGVQSTLNLKAVPFYKYQESLRAGKFEEANFYKELAARTPAEIITRDGYREEDLVDNKAKQLKFNTSLHYRPFGSDKLELILSTRYSKVNSIVQGGDRRFAFKNAESTQYSLDVKGDHYFLRGYVSKIDAGDSYELNTTATLLNEFTPGYKNSKQWFNDYLTSYILGSDLKTARYNADNVPSLDGAKGRLEPGTNDFKKRFYEVLSKTDVEGGSKILEKSNAYKVDGNFNFGKYIDFVEILVGGSHKEYSLLGALFNNTQGRIKIQETGIYTQLRKSFLEDRFKITSSIRYDKATNYKGNYSPRIALSYLLGEDKNHLLRISGQTAFRNPRNQDQYINLTTGNNNFTLGNIQENLDNFKQVIEAGNKKLNIDGNFPFENEDGSPKTVFDTKTLNGYIDNIANALTQSSTIEDITRIGLESSKNIEALILKKNVQPEEVTSFELGYRGMINLTPTNLLEVDINGYYNRFKNFIYYKNVTVPIEGNAGAPKTGDINGDFGVALSSALNEGIKFSIPVNTKTILSSYGLGISTKTKIFNTFDLNVNYAWNNFEFADKEESQGFEPSFNLPEHNVKLSISNENIIKNLGFNIAARWQSKYLYESMFYDGMIDQRTVIDAQISFKVPKLKSRFRLGANNLLGKSYVDYIGGGNVGNTYYLSWLIND